VSETTLAFEAEFNGADAAEAAAVLGGLGGSSPGISAAGGKSKNAKANKIAVRLRH